MALTKHDLNQIDKLIDHKLDVKLKKAFDDFFTNKLLPVLSQFVTKAEIEPMKQDIQDLKHDVNYLKDGFVRLENKLDREELRNRDAHAYLEKEINVVRSHSGLTTLPPLLSSGS